jgi:hypothetical protein
MYQAQAVPRLPPVKPSALKESMVWFRSVLLLVSGMTEAAG